MKRRVLFKIVAAFGLVAAFLGLALGKLSAGSGTGAAPNVADGNKPSAIQNPLTPPAHGSIPVAFLISEGAVMIDFTGPWEVFQDVHIPGHEDSAFRLYTVAATAKPIHASGGMKIVPDYTIANAPAAKVIVIPAQSPLSEETKQWIRKATKNTDVTMSVCTGAFMLASTGLLSGKAAPLITVRIPPWPRSSRISRSSVEQDSLRPATSPVRADSRPVSIWRSGL
jgi:putative intracellular protease/amidase